MKNNNSVDVPLLFFSFAFVIIIFGIFSKLTVLKQPLFGNIQKTITPTVIKKNIVSTIKFNQPIICDYHTKDSTISASIDTSSIAVTIAGQKEIQRYLLSGDCLYSWIMNGNIGQKKCGLGTSVAVGRQALSSGLISLDSLPGLLPKSEKMNIDFQEAIKSCKNVTEIRKESFILPKGIVFD